MSTSSGTINSSSINAITLFCAGFTKEQIQNAEHIEHAQYSYDTGRNNNGGLDINQSDWRDYTSAFAEDFNDAEIAATHLGVLFVNFFGPQGELLVTTQHPWGAENISNEPGFRASDFAIHPTYREFVAARQTIAQATPNPQSGGKSHKKRRKSHKKRRKSRKKRRKSRSKKRRKSRKKKKKISFKKKENKKKIKKI
jgi:hypothetical protein